MRIKSITINSFKGMKNRTIDLDDNFNIIYGPNQAGKPSIVSFIRAMLYGLPKNGKDGILGPRLSCIPLNKKSASGSLKVEHEGRMYVIERVFGEAPRFDEMRFYD